VAGLFGYLMKKLMQARNKDHFSGLRILVDFFLSKTFILLSKNVIPAKAIYMTRYFQPLA
jgi:hypothetical protein